MTDALGPDCKLVWAQDEAGEIGKRPKLAADEFEIDGETLIRLAEHDKAFGRKKR